MPDLYAHTDYRAFVRAWLEEHPKRSQRWIAAKLGVAPALVSMILAGDRDLGLHHARPFGRILGLEDEPLNYFDALVRAEHGPTHEIRKAARHHVQAMRDFVGQRSPTADQFDWFGSWVHLSILGLARLDGFRPEPAWVCARLWPEVAPEVARAALDDLLAANVLIEADGGWSIDQTPLGTGQRVTQPDLARAARQLHLDQFDHAGRAIDAHGPDRRFTASVSLAVAHENVPRLIAALHRFHLDVIEPFRDGPAEQLVDVVVAMYPRSRAP
ncbi:MAG: TIGR02147 family protein [Myxococcota bacterium]